MLLTDTRDHVRTLTLNRPDKRNALSTELYSALLDGLRAARSDDDVRAVIVTGADPAFCAGLDLVALTEGGLLGLPNLGQAIRGVGKPIIAAVNGVAVTGGLEIALNCDFIIASDRARFGDTHAAVGLIPGWGLSALLPARIGLARAKQMSLTGRFTTASEAEMWGLANHVVPHDELLAFTHDLASRMANLEPRTAAAMMQLYNDGAGRSLADALTIEATSFTEWGLDRDRLSREREGIMGRGRAQTGEA